MLDDVFYRGVNGRNDYTGTITEAQLEWLEKDLSYVDPDKAVIIGLHIPTKRRNSSTHVTNNQALYDLVKDFRKCRSSGHSHNHYTTTIALKHHRDDFRSRDGSLLVSALQRWLATWLRRS